MSIFKVEFTLWVDDDGPSVSPRELVVEAVYAHNYRSTVLDWKETEMTLEVAPEVVLVEAPKGQTLEEWQEEMAELRRRAREAINEHEA